MARIVERLPSNVSELGQCLIELTYHLCQGGFITTAYIREKYGVSRSTAIRYVNHLERVLPLQVQLQPAENELRPRKILRLKAAA